MEVHLAKKLPTATTTHIQPMVNNATGMFIGATWSLIITMLDISKMIPTARKTVLLFRIDSAPFMIV